MSEHENYDEWHEGYQQRGEAIQEAVGQTVFEAIGSGSLEEARQSLREARAAFEHEFCLLLYASGTDEEVAADLADTMDDRLTREELQSALELASQTSVSQPLTLMMLLLDRYKGMHLLLLERPNDEPPEGPIRIRTPDPIWFESFKLVAELAQAIIVIGDFGFHLIEEMEYLGQAGLKSRVLVYINGNVYSFKGYEFDELDKWTVFDVDKAVEYAAAQAVG